MRVLNISFQIAPTLQEQWLEWMKNKFIPMIIATECFHHHQFYQLDITSDQAPTYTLQLFSESPEKLVQYQEKSAPALMDELLTTWGDQCFNFITTMQIVN